MTQQEIMSEAITRATTGQSVMNYAAIFEGFMARGIPESEILPRENVLTFWAWKAIGRRVKKGEHGVKACTFIPVSEKVDTQTGEKKAGFRVPRTTTVFHVSQTEPEPDGAPGNAPAIVSDAEIMTAGPRCNRCDQLLEDTYHTGVFFHTSPCEPLGDVLTTPAPKPPAPASDPRIARFRTWADALQPKIDHAGRPMTQNPTPKRNREYQSRLHDCRNMERLQKALRVLADGHESGTVSAQLADLRTKDEIGALVRKFIDGSRGGYYSCIEASDYADTSERARVLQGMIEGTSAQRAEREHLRRIGELEAQIALATIPGYFPTPAPVVSLMLQRARIEDGMTVLEPSAGSGHIADEIRKRFPYPSVSLSVIECSCNLRDLLTLKQHVLIGSDFMADDINGEWDRIVMNPPFEHQQDIDHVRRAWTLLRPGGVLVAIMAPGFEFHSDRKSTEFRQWLDDVEANWEELPEGSFRASGTGVGTRLVVIEKT